jgi:hypothetical protein
MFWPKVVWSKCVTACLGTLPLAQLAVTPVVARRYGDTLADFKVRCFVRLARRKLCSPLNAAQEPENIDNAVSCLNHLARFPWAALFFACG